MKKLLVIALLLFTQTIYAQQDYPREITVDWTNPTQYVDGSIIEAGDLESIRIEVFRHDDPVTPVYTATVPDTGEGLSQSEVFADAIPQPGTYTVYGYAIVVDGTESDPSAPAQKKYTGKPRPITTVTVE
jgi:hypothetical protein